MDRKKFIKTSSFILTGLALFNQNLLATFLNEPAWKIKMLTNDIGVFTEKGGTIGFYISTNGIVVIDAQFPEQSQNLINAIKEKSQSQFKLLINTHHHYDHTSGNISFKNIVSKIVAHKNSLINQKAVAVLNKSEDNQLYPNITFTNSWHKKIGNEKIRLHYFGPAHTNGDSVVHFENSNIVHLGDLLFNRKHPYIDKTAGANIENWIKVLDKINNTFDVETIFICGHAGEGYDILPSKNDIVAFKNYLENVLLFVDDEIKLGKTKEEILKAKQIPNTENWKGEGIERPLMAAFIELTTKHP